MNPAARPDTVDPAIKTRVLIVDDHAVVRIGITARLAIEPDMIVCGEAETSAEALRQIEALAPDVVILDLSLAGGSGLDLLKSLQAHGSKAKVLVVSGQDEAIYAERCMRAGASGYLSKTEAVHRIVDGIRCIRDGGHCLSNAITARIQGHLSAHQGNARAHPLQALSDRELQIYEALGAGLTVKGIAAKFSLSHKTVDTYRTKLKQKLGIEDSHQLTRHAMLWLLEQVRG